MLLPTAAKYLDGRQLVHHTATVLGKFGWFGCTSSKLDQAPNEWAHPRPCPGPAPDKPNLWGVREFDNGRWEGLPALLVLHLKLEAALTTTCPILGRASGQKIVNIEMKHLFLLAEQSRPSSRDFCSLVLVASSSTAFRSSSALALS